MEGGRERYATLIANFSIFTSGILMSDHNLHILASKFFFIIRFILAMNFRVSEIIQHEQIRQQLSHDI